MKASATCRDGCGLQGLGRALACLCSSDEVYAQAVEAAKALKAGGRNTSIWPDGRRIRTPSAAGIRTFIYAGCDALRMLTASYGSSG